MARVLVIDDIAEVRTTLRGFLESAGHLVDEAGDGLEGAELYSKVPFDVVVTDIVMPNREGLETILRLKRHHAGTKVIAITGYAKEMDLLRIAKSFGADAILEKPVDMDVLIEAVNRCLET